MSTTGRKYNPILPFCFFTIRASRTSLRFRNLSRKGFILNPENLGQHLKSRRLLLKLTQDQVAKQLRTVREQYERWERDEISPVVSFWPRLIRFLGYYPAPNSSPANWVLRARRMLGLSQYAFGRKVKTIAKVVRQWEHGETELGDSALESIKALTRAGDYLKGLILIDSSRLLSLSQFVAAVAPGTACLHWVHEARDIVQSVVSLTEVVFSGFPVLVCENGGTVHQNSAPRWTSRWGA